MVSDKTLIFHMCIPFGKTFSLVPSSRSSVKIKAKYQGNTFQEIAVSLCNSFYLEVGKKENHTQNLNLQYKKVN